MNETDELNETNKASEANEATGDSLLKSEEDKREWEQIERARNARIAELNELIAEEKISYNEIRDQIKNQINSIKFGWAVAGFVYFDIYLILLLPPGEGEAIPWLALLNHGLFAIGVSFIGFLIFEFVLRKTTIRVLEERLKSCKAKVINMKEQKLSLYLGMLQHRAWYGNCNLDKIDDLMDDEIWHLVNRKSGDLMDD